MPENEHEIELDESETLPPEVTPADQWKYLASQWGNEQTTASQVAAHNQPSTRTDRGRQGRAPKLNRVEVESIQNDHRTAKEIARAWAISETLVARVKQIGRFKGIPYIPSDEYERDNPKHLMTAAAFGEHHYGNGRYLPTGSGSGRKPVGRDRHLTLEEKIMIANDKRTMKSTAAAYGITIGYVAVLRREHRRLDIRKLMDHEIMAIRMDPRDAGLIGSIYAIPAEAVRRIKRNINPVDKQPLP